MNADPKLDPNVRPVRGFGVIGSDGVHMHLSTGSGNATTISDFRLCLVSSEAPDLSQFFNPYIVDFSSQHPCVVSVDTVKTRLQLGVDHSIGALNATIHKELVDDLAHASGRQQSIVQSFFDSFISTTFGAFATRKSVNTWQSCLGDSPWGVPLRDRARPLLRVPASAIWKLVICEATSRGR